MLTVKTSDPAVTCFDSISACDGRRTDGQTDRYAALPMSPCSIVECDNEYQLSG